MGRYTGPKTKVSRRYGVPLFGPSKSLERKNYPPGMHGPKGSRRKQSDYAIALGEKQKLRYQYGLLERQFRRIFQNALRKRGVTGETLLQLLETRLDNVVFRLGLANTRSGARQLVSHGHVLVNGRDGEHFLLQRESRRRNFGERQTEDATTGAAQSRADPDRPGARLADGRSRCSQRQSRPHSLTGRNSTDGQRAVDRRVVFPVTVAAHTEEPGTAVSNCRSASKSAARSAVQYRRVSWAENPLSVRTCWSAADGTFPGIVVTRR